MNNEWLANLKKGDAVAIASGYRGMSLSTVERTTATQIITASGSKFRRADGHVVGGDQWSILSIIEPTPEITTAVRKTHLCQLLRRVVWEKVNIDVLERVFSEVKNGQHL